MQEIQMQNVVDLQPNRSKNAKGGMALPFQPLALTFHNVCYYVDMPTEMKNEGAKGERLQLLRNVSGALIRPGVLTALVGVSSAGKTILMDVLAGRKTGGYIEGDIRISGFPKRQDTFARVAGYVEQTDIQSPQLTVQESLAFSSWLRLPKETSSVDREMGLCGALETMCGQAFGAGEHQKLGIYMQRSMVVLNIVSVPLACLWFYMERIFLALGQDAQLASKAGDYGVWLIPTLFAFSFYMPLLKFLQAQSLVIPIFTGFTVALVCHVPICWALVFRSSLGYKGAALANSISVWIIVMSLALYVKFSPRCAASRAPLSSAALQDLKSFLKLAIPSAMMTCLEWWTYEILVLLSAFLSNPELQTGIIAICVNSETMLYMIPSGVAAAVSTRVSNELGAGNPQAARGAVNVARILGMLEALILVVVLLLVRNVWGLIYSSDEEVVTAITGYIPLFATSSAFDALQTVLSGVVRGAGWQQAGAYMSLGSFYFAGLPTGCLLAFVAHLEGKGLWAGLIVGTMVQFSAYTLLVWRIDWEREAKKAAARTGLKGYPSWILYATDLTANPSLGIVCPEEVFLVCSANKRNP